MKLIVGLGNPGSAHAMTRHNAGFMVVDRLAARHAPASTPRARFNGSTLEAEIGGEKCLLLKPLTYMNRSGGSVAEAVRFYKLSPATDLLVISDDVALPPGTMRLRPGGGAGGHNGLADIERALGVDQYPRLRVGIGASPPFMDQADYVLARVPESEMALFEAALEQAADAAEEFVRRGVETAMNRYNARPRPPGAGDGPGGPDSTGRTDPGRPGGDMT
jgi:PTH1 family peptidyl-tRNA hydrolase